ncbi:MAG: hypothetical protein H6936_00115 [Burkholderiales bacterium]|uniref:hypothetical protein n=1 Tax=Nitrosomonas sp. TaxID=42353 RepID=UPI001DE1B538|nr:hypothetical protein [Nitrosomonas sp.]MCB1949964.1 hypothetical protein [Nitrosomonas sp.]MCP5273262.1 hypothetical protein [Burkholderiales bacterium]
MYLEKKSIICNDNTADSDIAQFQRVDGEELLSSEEGFPFHIVRVLNIEDLSLVTQLRQKSYGRHLPEFGRYLASPEKEDDNQENIVLLITSKSDNMPLATIRIHTNGHKLLPLEHTIALPDSLRSSTLAEAVRFSVINGAEGRLPRDTLFKAFYLICSMLKIEWMIICARRPLQKLYYGLAFEDIFPDKESIPFPHIGNIPHRVLKLRVGDVEKIWNAMDHPLYNFFFETQHPELDNLLEDLRLS